MSAPPDYMTFFVYNDVNLMISISGFSDTQLVLTLCTPSER